MNDKNDLTAGQYDGWTESLADEICYSNTDKPIPCPKNNERHAICDKDFYSHFKGGLNGDENGLNYTADDKAIDEAIKRIKNPVDDIPLCIFLGLFYQHVPYQVEKPYFSAIQRDLLKKRIKIEDTKDEFYDLINDPNELINESDNTKYKDEIIDMKNDLLKHLQQTSDIVPFDYDQRLTKEMTWPKVCQYVPKGYEDIIKEKIKQGMGQVPIIMYCLSLNKSKES